MTFRFRLPLGDFELDASGHIPGTGVTALFGRSGCGKTRLLRCLAGLEIAQQAWLSVDGDCWHDSARNIFLPPNERAIGYVFQEGALFPHLRVRGNLEFGLKRSGSPRRKEHFERVAELLGLTPLLERYPARLSGGEKQRVAIGRALLNEPRMLLMDEPLAALDRSHKREILPYLESLHQQSEIPIVYVTHDPEELVRIADHLVLMDQGNVLAQGPLTELSTRLDLPMAREFDAGSVIDARVISHDPEYHLSTLGFQGGELTVAWVDRPLGSAVRIRIHARDISLALSPPGPSSILNVLPVIIEDMAVHGRGRMIIRLNCNGLLLLARITAKSRARLDLAPGMQVYAQIKSVALTI